MSPRKATETHTQINKQNKKLQKEEGSHVKSNMNHHFMASLKLLGLHRPVETLEALLKVPFLLDSDKFNCPPSEIKIERLGTSTVCHPGLQTGCVSVQFEDKEGNVYHTRTVKAAQSAVTLQSVGMINL